MLTKTRSDIERLARELGVRPPPEALSSEAERNVAYLLGDVESEEPSESPLVLTPTREGLLANLGWSLRHSWPSRTGPVDRLTYNAVVRTAIAANSLIVGMSRYTLAELAGISPSTAHRSLNRHVAAARFAKLAPESEELALRYHVLDVLQSDTRHTSDSLLTAVSGIEMQQPPPDLFRAAGGLSKAALRVYEVLDPTRPQTAAELARKLDRNRSSVSRILPKLYSAGLAQDLEEGWVRTDANLEQVAEDYGVKGAAERMRCYNAQQRQAYRAFLGRKKEQQG
jgi:hypothetical protein